MSQGGETRDCRQWGFWGSPLLQKGVLGAAKGRNEPPGTPGVKEKGGGWERQDVWEESGQENGL